MFMHKSKKGFTIVELVIVIAVIAILAAVLIPTFSNLVKKANMSADQQAVRQMNTVLAAELELEDGDQAKQALKDAGYNSAYTLIPTSEGHFFFFVKDLGKVVLTDKDLKIVYPQIDGYTGNIVPVGSWNLKLGLTNTIADTPEKFVEHVNAGTFNVAATTNVKMDTAISVAQKNINVGTGVVVEVPQLTAAGATTTLLGEGTLKTNIVNNGDLAINKYGNEVTNLKIEAADPSKPLITVTSSAWGATAIYGGVFDDDIIFEIASGKSVSISGGTFNGKPYYQMTEQDWKDICLGEYFISVATKAGDNVLIMAQ